MMRTTQLLPNGYYNSNWLSLNFAEVSHLNKNYNKACAKVKQYAQAGKSFTIKSNMCQQ